MTIDLRHMRCFAVLAEELHFRRAAERLHISQPPLTSAIQALERELGVRLFERTRRQVLLTEHGRLLLERARAILALSEQFKAMGQQAALGHLGKIRFGMTISAPFITPFAEALREFRSLSPDVVLETTHTVAAGEAIAALRNNTLDVCVFRAPRTIHLPARVRHFVVHRDRAKLVLPSGHPLAPLRKIALPQLREERFLLYRPNAHATDPVGPVPSYYDRMFADLFGRAGLVLPRTQAVADVTAILGLVSAHLGISMLPGSLHRLRATGVEWCDIDAPRKLLESDIILAYREDDGTNPAVRRFVDLVATRSPDPAG